MAHSLKDGGIEHSKELVSFHKEILDAIAITRGEVQTLREVVVEGTEITRGEPESRCESVEEAAAELHCELVSLRERIRETAERTREEIVNFREWLLTWLAVIAVLELALFFVLRAVIPGFFGL